MNDRWDRGHGPDRGTMVLGGILVLAGLVFFVAEVYGVDLGRVGWPLFIIVPGAALLLLGFGIGGEGGLGAAIPGGIITAVGLLLGFQAATDTYASWAYAWALVAPTSIGLTMLVYGLVHGRPDLLDAGLRTSAVGLTLFVCFGLFFENVVGLDANRGTNAWRDIMPAAAIVVGVLIVVASLVPRPKPRAPEARPWDAPPPPPPAGPSAGPTA